MKIGFKVLAAGALFATLALIGCGHSSSGSSRSAGYSKGVVTANTGGSVVVNSVSFATGGSTITVDRSAGTSADLKVGKVVKIKGLMNDDNITGSGSAIEFDDNLEGMITALTTTSFTVFGQTVQVDANTVFAGTTGLSGGTPLVMGDVVEVSGFPNSTGTILATFVEKRIGVTEFEIKGTVSNYTGGGTFTLTPMNSTVSIAVTIGTTTIPSGFGNGKLVEVWTKDVSAGTTITASRIELEIEIEPGENEKVEVEGYVTSLTSLSSFVVNGVTVDASTAAITGGTAVDVKLNAKVEAEGSFSGGALKAATVWLKTTW